MAAKYCMECGQPMARRLIDDTERLACTACGFVHWGNYSIGVGALVIRDGKVLLVRRAQEPGKGLWTNPGGYIEQLESIRETIRREVLEEAGKDCLSTSSRSCRLTDMAYSGYNGCIQSRRRGGR
ncbi:NUDIX hydrolase [Paenibacillus darwinianus]|uniref:NUDIX hydrolase n=1 Tax=Paenibacillus darwinianus TaxID=1380763 RepID=A0A9W5W6T6_9BACL|nr:NUDIX hydrolase [Paenibacillus darwinianus]EXX87678.1 NUDIX hydrolase [Paenibacillus darwinianus]EXX90063.1 NUDIX hydrolase [Paenibacillus darwinianus]EXX90887.1 NUDIX hydrolase [Paenibacillus darwinianus]